jgi:DNA-binding transcriptional LysR family regulator
MTNIPTDLLRTFVLVVEQRSFTRAAKAQGMTQPAISAQIRRLQSLLGIELFDKSAPGVALTPMGQHVIESARRLLSVNDHIVQIASPIATAQLIRIGVRKDCMGEELTAMLAATRARWPNLRFAVQGAGQRRLLQYLKQDELDIVVALVPDEPEGSARHYWPEELAWVRGKTTTLDLSAPIPLVGYKDRCWCRGAASRPASKSGTTGRCRRHPRCMAASSCATTRRTTRSINSQIALRKRCARPRLRPRPTPRCSPVSGFRRRRARGARPESIAFAFGLT